MRLIPIIANDLPPGRTWLCSACRTRIRTGQPHRAVEPYPHATIEPLFEREGE